MVRVSERVSESDEFTGCFWMKDLPAAAVTGAQSPRIKYLQNEDKEEISEIPSHSGPVVIPDK